MQKAGTLYRLPSSSYASLKVPFGRWMAAESRMAAVSISSALSHAALRASQISCRPSYDGAVSQNCDYMRGGRGECGIHIHRSVKHNQTSRRIAKTCMRLIGAFDDQLRLVWSSIVVNSAAPATGRARTSSSGSRQAPIVARVVVTKMLTVLFSSPHVATEFSARTWLKRIDGRHRRGLRRV